MQITNRMDNTAFKANVYIRSGSLVSSARHQAPAELAVARGLIKRKNVDTVIELNDNYLVMDTKTLAAKLLRRLDEAKIDIPVSSPEWSTVAGKYNEALLDIIKDRHTKRIG